MTHPGASGPILVMTIPPLWSTILRKNERIVGEDESDAATFADLYTLPAGKDQRCAADSAMHQPVSPSRDSPAVGSPDTGEDSDIVLSVGAGRRGCIGSVCPTDPSGILARP
jgi:hypothetical protein